MLNPSGKFTVKSAWEILRQPGDVLGDYKKLWIKGMPFKVSFLVWRFWIKRIPIGEVLIWKRRNTINHGGRMSYMGMELEINRNLFLLAKYNYPWLKNLPTSWPGLVRFLEEYIPTLGCRTVVWKLLEMGSFKCNSDGASKGNPSPSSGAFCIRNGEGNLFYAEVGRLFDGSNLVAEVVALRLGLEYCVQHNLLPVTLETDSLSLKNILDGSWEIPWGIVMEVKRIKMLMKDKEGLKY
ncbi:hypothetical protein KY289_025276 [Solanum tuberosum]|nr:hypothetical protein KY289_025276 [Solanum tuberosum]